MLSNFAKELVLLPILIDIIVIAGKRENEKIMESMNIIIVISHPSSKLD
jgi:hypothetical protein